MTRNWRAPACYVSVALVCAYYVWITPLVGVHDLFAGAGLGAALMWALTDWEARQQARRHAAKAPVQDLPEVVLCEKGTVRASRDFGGYERQVQARPPGGWEGRRPVAREPEPEREPEGIEEYIPQRHRETRESPIEAWRREVRNRDIEKMETQLRALAGADAEAEALPFGAPDRSRPGIGRRDGERWPRPAARVGTARAHPR